MVVIMKPLIHVLLQLFDGSVKLISERFSEKLVENGAVESFNKSVSPGSGHPGLSMFDIIEVQEYLVGMDHGPAAVLPAVIREDMFNHKTKVWIDVLVAKTCEENLSALERVIGQGLGDTALTGDWGSGGGF